MVLLRLAIAAKTTELGWVSGDTLGDPAGYHQTIRRLKQDLRSAGVDADNLIVNSRAKQYRLSVPRGHVALDPARLQGFQWVGLDRLGVAAKPAKASA